jgi:hypothetical protein
MAALSLAERLRKLPINPLIYDDDYACIEEAAAELDRREALEQALKELAAVELCEDAPEKCSLGSGPYCERHNWACGIDDMVLAARAALKG